ncbi:MAG TPA: hypothetical protein VFV75_14920 [Candidatus Polarisedimenticolaceae bacterium]|nr:hypothetical protein [Candidatus Polarisedimenticolaceae bacterium]
MGRLALAACALLLQVAPPPQPVSPPEPPAEAIVERVVPFTPGRAVPLNLELGPVRLRRVTFDVASADEPEGSILGALQGEDAATSSNLRARFDVEGEPAEPWVAEVRIELLDRRGRTIDRFGQGEGLDVGVATLHVDRWILAYVLPYIRSARIHVEARREG